LSSEEKSSVPVNAEIDYEALAHELYIALQGITSCPRGCQCCINHRGQALKTLMDFVNRWRE
jgi:hypothetical protein